MLENLENIFFIGKFLYTAIKTSHSFLTACRKLNNKTMTKCKSLKQI